MTYGDLNCCRALCYILSRKEFPISPCNLLRSLQERSATVLESHSHDIINENAVKQDRFIRLPLCQIHTIHHGHQCRWIIAWLYDPDCWRHTTSVSRNSLSLFYLAQCSDRLWSQVLTSFISPQISKMPHKDRKLVAIGTIRMLTQSTIMMQEPAILSWSVSSGHVFMISQWPYLPQANLIYISG